MVCESIYFFLIGDFRSIVSGDMEDILYPSIQVKKKYFFYYYVYWKYTRGYASLYLFLHFVQPVQKINWYS
jgi:hypothetical protein